MQLFCCTESEAMGLGFYGYSEDGEEVSTVEPIDAENFLQVLSPAQVERFGEVSRYQELGEITVMGIGKTYTDFMPGALVLQTRFNGEESVFELWPDGRILLAGTNNPPVFDTYAELRRFEGKRA